MSAWDPDHYLRFADERTRPALDLVSRIRLDNPRTIVDLGCGPGNSTQVLRRRWPGARLWGLDASREMISAAQDAYPDQEWLLGDIRDWSSSEPLDLVFSNAALQWLPDHADLVKRLFHQVAAGGVLAFQVPNDARSPVRLAIREVAEDPAWRRRMEEAQGALTLEEPRVYYDALATLADAVDVWETTYYHVMASPAAIVTWIAATGLRPFLVALDSERERARFVAMLQDRVSRAYAPRADGRTLFAFRRLFVIAYKEGLG